MVRLPNPSRLKKGIHLLGVLLILTGCTWFLLFPKKASLSGDMVVSVALGVGMVGTGVFLLLVDRLRRATMSLSILLLWSLLGNISLYILWDEAAEVGNQAVSVLLEEMENRGDFGR